MAQFRFSKLQGSVRSLPLSNYFQNIRTLHTMIRPNKFSYVSSNQTIHRKGQRLNNLGLLSYILFLKFTPQRRIFVVKERRKIGPCLPNFIFCSCMKPTYFFFGLMIIWCPFVAGYGRSLLPFWFNGIRPSINFYTQQETTIWTTIN